MSDDTDKFHSVNEEKGSVETNAQSDVQSPSILENNNRNEVFDSDGTNHEKDSEALANQQHQDEGGSVATAKADESAGIKEHINAAAVTVLSTGIDETTSEVVTTAAATTDTTQLSKNQLKKRRRLEKAMEIKQRKKQQNKQVRHERARAQGRDIDAERVQQEQARLNGMNRTKRLQEWQSKMMPQVRQSYQICIDCAYEAFMTPKEINSLAIQIRYCYSSNKRSPYPCQLTATSIGSTTSDDECNTNTDSSSNDKSNFKKNDATLSHLQRVNGFEEWSNWAFDVTSESLEKYFQNNIQNVIYLTSDAETTLTTLEDDKIYVIGGIVDRNRLKRIAYDRATIIGLRTAKLPIDDYLSTMPSTRVLTTNHVMELLLKYKQYDGSWKKALTDILPTRKDAKFIQGDET
jgi:tRNA (guanine9-N1)-methyltransferase